MLLDAGISIFAGLGLFFIGIKGLGANMSQLTGRSVRRWVARSTGNYALGALVGTLSGALTQSTNAITVILMSLASADLITPRKAKPILAWANIGTAPLVLIAALDIHLFILALLGAVGACFYLNLDRSKQWRPLVSAVLALALLFLGLEILRDGSHALRSLASVQAFFHLAAEHAVSGLLAGAVLAFVAQSSATVSVVAIAMTSAGLLTLEQAMMLVYGASVGSGLSTFMVASNIKGTSRQLAIFQVMVKSSGILLLLPLYAVENGFGVPLVAAGVRALADDPAHQVGFVYLIYQFASVGVEAAIDGWLQPLLEYLSPPSAEESLSRPRYIFAQAVHDPETALSLVEREQSRIFGLVPAYLGITGALEGEIRSLDRAAILAAGTALITTVEEFLSELADTGASREVLEGITNRRARNDLLHSLHEAFSELAFSLALPFEAPAMRGLADNLSEGLGALVLTAEEAIRTADANELALLLQLTAERDSLVDGLRRRVMGTETGLAAADQRHLYALTSLFERVVWMIRRYGKLLDANAQGAERPATASS
jgi:phosphate:Na+ symporter